MSGDKLPGWIWLAAGAAGLTLVLGVVGVAAAFFMLAPGGSAPEDVAIAPTADPEEAPPTEPAPAGEEPPAQADVDEALPVTPTPDGPTDGAVGRTLQERIAEGGSAAPPEGELPPALAENVDEEIAPETPAQQKKCQPDHPAVKSTGGNSWAVERNFLDKYTESPAKAEELADVSWARNKKGEVVGFRIRGLPCNSPLREAGFQKGDMIKSVNGKEIKSVPSAVAVYRQLRTSGNLNVKLRRKKVWHEQNYRLVESVD